MTTQTTSGTAADFIARWQASGAAERANYQLFLSELCEVLDLDLLRIFRTVRLTILDGS